MISARNLEKQRVYFSHSMQTYNTPAESKILKFLSERFAVLCPNQDIGKLARYKNYFFIINWADAVIVWEFEEGVTRGVFAEVNYARSQNIPVWCIREAPNGFVFFKVVGIEDEMWEFTPEEYGRLILREDDSPVFQS